MTILNPIIIGSSKKFAKGAAVANDSKMQFRNGDGGAAMSNWIDVKQSFGFTPNAIIAIRNRDGKNGAITTFQREGSLNNNECKIYVSLTSSTNASSEVRGFQTDGNGLFSKEGGFRMPVYEPGAYTWYAYE